MRAHSVQSIIVQPLVYYTKTQLLPIVVLNPAQPVRQLRLESLQRGLVGDDRKDGAKQISTKIIVLY